jgi:SAM-dependent methyltransferase
MPDGLIPFADHDADAYIRRLASEQTIYRECLEIHRLPDIFHYWSNRYVKPKLESFGFNSPDEMFRKFLSEHRQQRIGQQCRFVSVGSGNCDLEVNLAVQLRSTQDSDFLIDCLDLNPAMLERGRLAAREADVDRYLNFVQTDLNLWAPSCAYDAAIANQSLHHVQNLEGLFGNLQAALKPESPFIISDMIGRNGHQRWPEALQIVQEFWKQLPPSYRFNNKLHRYEESFENVDYSRNSFEGIRAQDILPMLREYFPFDLFIAFANIIDPFVDSAFGDNFNAASPWDRNFIDRVNRRDEEELAAGHIKPTHMVAVVRPGCDGLVRYHAPFSPEFCERRIGAAGAGRVLPSYDWDRSEHAPEGELEIACVRLKQLSERLTGQEALVEERTGWALRLDRELADRDASVARLQSELEACTRWARRLDDELSERNAQASELNNQLQERTAWALRLDEEIAQRNAEIVRLNRDTERANQELEERTAWALHLNRELQERSQEVDERTAWAMRLQRDLAERMAQVIGLQSELESLSWARALDRRFHRALDSIFRTIRRVRFRLKPS